MSMSILNDAEKRMFVRMHSHYRSLPPSHIFIQTDTTTSKHDKAYRVAAVCLQSKNQTIDPHNEDHQKFYKTATAVIEGATIDNFQETDQKRVIMEIRTVINTLYENNNNFVAEFTDIACDFLPLGGELAKKTLRYCLSHTLNPVSYVEVKSVFSKITTENIHEIISWSLTPDALKKVLVDYQQTLTDEIQTLQKESKVLLEQVSSGQVYQEGELQKISSQLQAVLDKQEVTTQQLVEVQAGLDTTSQKPAEQAKVDQTAKINLKLQYCQMTAEIAHCITEGIVGIKQASLSFSHAESRREDMKKQYMELSEELNISLEGFSNRSYQHVYPRVQLQIIQCAVKDKAKIIEVYTKAFCGQAERLQQSIDHYIKNRDLLDARSNTLASLDQKIINYYDAKLKQQNRKGHFWELTRGILGTAAGIAMAVDPTKISAGVLASMSAMATLPLLENQRRTGKTTAEYQDQYQRSSEVHQFTDWLEQQCSFVVYNCQLQARQHLDDVVVHKEYLSPIEFQNEVRKSIEICRSTNGQIKDKQQELKDEIGSRRKNISALESDRVPYEKIKIKRKLTKEEEKNYAIILREIEQNRNEIFAIQEQIKSNDENIKENQKSIENAQEELSLAKYVEPLAKNGDEFLKSVMDKTMAEKERTALNKTFAANYSARREYSSRNFRLRMVISQSLAPIASELDWLLGTNITSDILKCATAVDQLRDYHNGIVEWFKAADPVADCGKTIPETTADKNGASQTTTETPQEKTDIKKEQPKTNHSGDSKRKKRHLVGKDSESKESGGFLKRNRKSKNKQTPGNKSNGQGKALEGVNIGGDNTSNADDSIPVDGATVAEGTEKDRLNISLEKLDWANCAEAAVNVLGMIHSSLVIAHTLHSLWNFKSNVPITVTMSHMFQKQKDEIEQLFAHLFEKIEQHHEELKNSIQEAKLEILNAIDELKNEAKLRCDQLENNQFIPMIGRKRDAIRDQTIVQQGAALLKLQQGYLEECCQSYYNGVNQSLDQLDSVVKWPSCYSGWIYKELFGDANFPNLFLFDYTVSKLIETAQPGDPLLMQNIELALSQFGRIEKLLSFPDDLIRNVVKKQKEFIKCIRTGQESIQKYKQGRPMQAAKREDFDDLKKIIGWNKFALNRFKNKSLAQLDQNLSYLEQAKQIYNNNVDRNQIKLLLSSFSLTDLSQRIIWIDQPPGYNFLFEGQEGGAFRFIHDTISHGREYWMRFAISGPLEVFQMKQVDLVSHFPFVKENVASVSLAAKKALMEFSATLTTDKNRLKVTFHNNENSAVNLDDLQNITSAGYSIEECGQKTYDEAIRSLIDNYFEMLQGKPLNEDHLFASIQQEAYFLPSKDSSLVPLAFPKKLLENLESTLLRDKFFVECTELGFLQPVSYNLSCLRGSNYYELTIQYHFVPKPLEEKRGELPYCEIIVAEFDKSIVHAFGDVAITDEGFILNNFHFNEFLIQIFFCQLKPVLGIPGPGTWPLKGSLVAPKERKFNGLFQLLNKSSQKKPCFEIEEIEVNEEFTIRPDYQNYLKVQYEAKYKMKQFETQLKAYQHHYQLLLACFKLQTSLSEENLKRCLYASFSLIPPEAIQLLYLDLMEKDSYEMRSEVFMLEALIKKCPSAIKIALKAHYENLQELKSSLEDGVPAMLRAYSRNSNYINI